MAVCTNVTNSRAWALLDPMETKFDNCTAPSLWLVHVYRTMYPSGGQFPIQQSSGMLREVYRHQWTDKGARQAAPAEAELVSWFSDNIITCRQPGKARYDVADMLMGQVRQECGDQFCSRLPWQGNADQAGRGMMITYASEASLVTIYALVLLLSRIYRPRKSPKTRVGKLLVRIPESARESLRVFLDATLLFSFTMLVAAVFHSSMTLQAIDEQNLTPTLQAGDPRRSNLQVPMRSSIILSLLASYFSVFPTIILHSSASSSVRRSRLRTFLWALLGILGIIAFILGRIVLEKAEAFMKDRATTWKDPDGQIAFEKYCIDPKLIDELWKTVVAAFACTLTLLFWKLVAGFADCVPKVSKVSKLSKLSKVGNFVAVVVATLAMWTNFGLFYYYRNKMGKRAGGTNKDHDWSFGQILAIGTFVPIVIEFSMIEFEGAEEALTGSLSTRFEAKPTQADGDRAKYDSLETSEEAL